MILKAITSSAPFGIQSVSWTGIWNIDLLPDPASRLFLSFISFFLPKRLGLLKDRSIHAGFVSPSSLAFRQKKSLRGKMTFFLSIQKS